MVRMTAKNLTDVGTAVHQIQRFFDQYKGTGIRLTNISIDVYMGQKLGRIISTETGTVVFETEDKFTNYTAPTKVVKE